VAGVLVVNARLFLHRHAGVDAEAVDATVIGAECRVPVQKAVMAAGRSCVNRTAKPPLFKRRNSTLVNTVYDLVNTAARRFARENSRGVPQAAPETQAPSRNETAKTGDSR